MNRNFLRWALDNGYRKTPDGRWITPVTGHKWSNFVLYEVYKGIGIDNEGGLFPVDPRRKMHPHYSSIKPENPFVLENPFFTPLYDEYNKVPPPKLELYYIIAFNASIATNGNLYYLIHAYSEEEAKSLISKRIGIKPSIISATELNHDSHITGATYVYTP